MGTRNSTRFVAGSIDIRRGSFATVLDDVSEVDMFITSPPYNIGSRSSKRITNRRFGGFDAKSWGAIEGYQDSLPEVDYQDQQVEFLLWCEERLAKGGVIVYNHKNRHVRGRVISPLEWILRVQDQLVVHDEIVWNRGSTHNHAPAFVYPESERIYVLKRPGERIHFRNQDFFWLSNQNKGCGDVWNIPPARGSKHNAPFPLKLARHCLRLFSKKGDLVCDPYLGSGTSAVAAELEGRQFVGSERLAKYFKMAQSRLCEQYQGVA